MPQSCIPRWWQLPFASALTYQALMGNRCYLCSISACQPVSAGHIQRAHRHWFNRQRYLCEACHQRIHWQAAHFDLHLPTQSLKGVASASYSYPLDEVMLGFKNSQQLHGLPVLVHAIRQLQVPTGCHAKNALIVRVPTTKQRLQQRGFDPLGILTAYLSFHWQIPVFYGVYRLDRPHQQGLSREERLSNMTGAFFLSHPPPVKHLILFDDVVTTGATMDELAHTLLATGKNHTLFARSVLHGI